MDYRFNIALIYDFDGTLAPGNMQEYDFIPAVGKSNKEFWTEANTLAEEQDADMVLTYMARMLQEAKSKGLSLRREAFQESGRRVTLYKGVREWFGRINAYGAARGIRILHYINSSGMKEIIEGTEIILLVKLEKYFPGSGFTPDQKIVIALRLVKRGGLKLNL